LVFADLLKRPDFRFAVLQKEKDGGRVYKNAGDPEIEELEWIDWIGAERWRGTARVTARNASVLVGSGSAREGFRAQQRNWRAWQEPPYNELDYDEEICSRLKRLEFLLWNA